MENKITITFSDRQVLLLFRSITESLSSCEEALDDCYSCGDIKCINEALAEIDELNLLSRRLAPFVSPTAILNKEGDE